MASTYGIQADAAAISLLESISTTSSFRACRIDLLPSGILTISATPLSVVSDDTKDFSLLPALVSTEPTYIVYRLNSGKAVLISFVPDKCGVRAKVQHSSARPALLKAIPEDLLQGTLFVSNISELSPEGCMAYLRNAAVPQPMTESEKVEREADAEAAAAPPVVMNRAGLGMGMMAAGLQMQWAEDLGAQMNTVADPTATENVLILHIKDEKLCLLNLAAASLSEVASLIPLKTPSFAFIRVPHARKILFVYTCPQGSPVKMRMQFSSQARSLPKNCQEKSKIVIAAKVETDDPSEITADFIISEVGPEDPEPSPVQETAEEVEDLEQEPVSKGNVESPDEEQEPVLAPVSPQISTPSSATSVKPIVPPKRTESSSSVTSPTTAEQPVITDSGISELKLSMEEEQLKDNDRV